MSDKNTPKASSEAAQNRMLRTRQRNTTAERKIAEGLRALGFQFETDQRAVGTVPSRADIVFRQAKVAVYVHGCFWHGCPKHATWPRANAAWWREKIMANICRDRRNRRALNKAGWSVMVIWEHVDPELAMRRVVSMLANVTMKSFSQTPANR